MNSTYYLFYTTTLPDFEQHPLIVESETYVWERKGKKRWILHGTIYKDHFIRHSMYSPQILKAGQFPNNRDGKWVKISYEDFVLEMI